MKHSLCEYEAEALGLLRSGGVAAMNRSALFLLRVPKARFIAEGCFIFHAPKGALH